VLEEMHDAKGVPEQDNLVNKNIIKSENSAFESSNPKKAGLDSKDKKTLIETFNLFNEMFFAYQKKMKTDTKEKTLISSIAASQEKQSPPTSQQTKGNEAGGGFLKTLLGGLGILGGIVALLYGLMTDGPLKGIMKVLSKILVSGGTKMLSNALTKLIGYVGKIFKFPLQIISKFGKEFFDNMAKGAGNMFTKILPKGGKGFFGKIAGNILKVLKPAAKLLKRIPIIGTLISVGFAISRFKSGDTVGGIIDVLSGLVGLLDLVVPGLGFGLSLGLDVLNAFLDVKAGGSSEEASKKKSDILWNMAKGLGSWIWDHAEYIPVVGTVKMFGKAYESFKGGNYLDMLKNIGMGLVYMVPGSALLIDGIGMLMGFFSGEKETGPTINTNKSWFSKLKDWVKSKLKDLPWWIKKPLSWFGIMEDDSGVTSNVIDSIGSGVEAGFEKTKEFIGGIWDNIKGPIGDAIGVIGNFASDTWNKTKELGSKAWDNIKEMAPQVWDSIKDISGKAWDKAKEAGSWFAETISSMANKTKDMVNEWIPKIVDTISGIADSAMEVLKNIANKIGGWITGLFSSEDEKKIKEVKTPVSEAENFLSKDSGETAHMLIKGNITSNGWLNVIHKSSMEQVRLLGMLVNVGNSSLSELKRMSGNSSSGGSRTVVMSPPQQAPKTPSISIDNNRMGFATSAYSLG
jgi:hypothetical protein